MNEKIASIHKQYLLADRMKLHLQDAVRLKVKFSNSGFLKRRLIRLVRSCYGSTWEKSFFRKVKDDQFLILCLFQSTLLYLTIFYGLVYSTVEAWIEYGIKDVDVEELLKDQSKLDQLRKFRNATFHVQSSFISAKQSEFLEEPDTEIWLKKLHLSLGKALANHPDITAHFEKGLSWSR